MTSTWTGAVDNDWSTAGNWDNGVSDNPNSAAIFPINASPTLSEEITLQGVILQNNSIVDLTAENFAVNFSTLSKQTSTKGQGHLYCG